MRLCENTDPQEPLVLDVPEARQLAFCNLQLTATSQDVGSSFLSKCHIITLYIAPSDLSQIHFSLGILLFNMTFKLGALTRRVLFNVTIPGTGAGSFPSQLFTCTQSFNCTTLLNPLDGGWFTLVDPSSFYDTPTYSTYSAPISQILIHLNRIRCTTSNLSPYCSSWTLTSISITQQRSPLCGILSPRPTITRTNPDF